MEKNLNYYSNINLNLGHFMPTWLNKQTRIKRGKNPLKMIIIALKWFLIDAFVISVVISLITRFNSNLILITMVFDSIDWYFSKEKKNHAINDKSSQQLCRNAFLKLTFVVWISNDQLSSNVMTMMRNRESERIMQGSLKTNKSIGFITKIQFQWWWW